MSDFDLDLGAVEEHIEVDGEETAALEERIVLGILDGTTPPSEWRETVAAGDVLLLCVEGDVNELAAGFARDVAESGGNVVHFRGFLIVTPPGVDVNTDRL